MTARKLPPGDRPLKTLERVLSKAGLGSRREARSWVAAGRVAVNGTVIRDPDRWIDLERDRVRFDGEPLQPKERVYLLLDKPVGYLTAYRDPERRPTVYDLLPDLDSFVFYAGRLDRDTSGLLILTNDAAFAEHLTNPRHAVPKTYRVTTDGRLPDEALQRLRGGITLEDGPTRPAIVERDDDSSLLITITEGRNRQVRRMIDAVGGRVVALERIAIGGVTAGDLAAGEARRLTPEEIASLRSL